MTNSPKNLESFGANKPLIETRIQLAKEIEKKYGISQYTAENFLKKDTLITLHDLKNELTSKGNTLSETTLSELQSSILGYQELYKVSSKLARDRLKISLETNNSILSKSIGDEFIQKYASSLFIRVKNPKNISDHITGVVAGIAVSTITLLDVCYRIGIGLLKAPKDLFDIAQGNGVYENWKRL